MTPRSDRQAVRRPFTEAVRAFCAVLLFCILTAGAAGVVNGSDESRIVRGQVLNVDGTPASSVGVYIVGGGRMSLITYDEAVEKNLGWDTDTAGRFEAKFANQFPNFLWPQPQLFWGSYHFVVPPGKSHCGAISCDIVNPDPREEFKEPSGGSPWGKRAILSDIPATVVLQLKKGIVVQGVVLDPANKPISDAKVEIHHEVGVYGRTGGGGEIFLRTTTTGDGGRFVFENVYPASFHLSLGHSLAWLRTRLGENGPWVEDCVDDIPADGKTRRVFVAIGASPRDRLFVHGIVTDTEGMPIASARIIVGLSFHRTPKEISDFRGWIEGNTEPDGRYRIVVGTPWIRFIRAHKDGYQGKMTGSVNEAWLRPDTYNFRLKKSAE